MVVNILLVVCLVLLGVIYTLYEHSLNINLIDEYLMKLL